ncbi:MAG TPA: DUF3047 domain-containing protein [Burkholderiaceae bacterium]|nr:DUF3047 domain-containing protein [Burkholderiaceae bacterium]
MRTARLLLHGLIGIAAGHAAAQAQALSPLAAAPPWRLVGLAHQTKPFTQFSMVEHDGRHALRIEADRSYGNLVHALAPTQALHHLAWHWQVDLPNTAADLRQRSGEDMAVRVCALFDTPLERLSWIDRGLLKAMRLRSGEAVPPASLCYVWDSRLEPGTLVESPFTRRVRFIVLRGPESPPHRWADERRDLDADFIRAFGDESKEVPPLIGVAVGADADNTGLHTLAYLSDLALER